MVRVASIESNELNRVVIGSFNTEAGTPTYPILQQDAKNIASISEKLEQVNPDALVLGHKLTELTIGMKEALVGVKSSQQSDVKLQAFSVATDNKEKNSPSRA